MYILSKKHTRERRRLFEAAEKNLADIENQGIPLAAAVPLTNETAEISEEIRDISPGEIFEVAQNEFQLLQIGETFPDDDLQPILNSDPNMYSVVVEADELPLAGKFWTNLLYKSL